MTDDLDRSIIATLSYYGAMRWPLAPMEVHERLIPAARVGGSTIEPTAAGVFGRLAELAGRGEIASHDGMYGPVDFPVDGWATRVNREKESAAKWRRMRRSAWWLQAVPYVKAFFASGSLASGQATADSDWDIFVIAQAGRLYTARACVLAASWLMGRLRTKHHVVAPDRFCFNHYITTDGLALRHRGIFMAHTMHGMIAVHDPEGYLERFRKANEWTGDFIAHTRQATTVRREVSHSAVLDEVRKLIQWVLELRAGDTLEHVMQNWQQRRIMAEPATYETGGRVVADGNELEFHPRSFERTVLQRYHRTLRRSGLGGFVEPDSGLTS